MCDQQDAGCDAERIQIETPVVTAASQLKMPNLLCQQIAASHRSSFVRGYALYLLRKFLALVEQSSPYSGWAGGITYKRVSSIRPFCCRRLHWRLPTLQNVSTSVRFTLCVSTTQGAHSLRVPLASLVSSHFWLFEHAGSVSVKRSMLHSDSFCYGRVHICAGPSVIAGGFVSPSLRTYPR